MKSIIYSRALFVLLLMAATIVYFTDFSGRHISAADTPNVLYTVTVQPGDTLWRIAAQYSNDQQDIREVIWTIKRYNHLRSSTLYPGQTLVLPALSPVAGGIQFTAMSPASSMP